ncbi:hypothetical protein BD410DRAFT_726563 [Rickenella mellea]|uniref:Autophagy-related protein 14 n=1 Tax=Rickenella mellea TaxID=50990 RepID=A0A4Y7PY76_9AGAM|nr:hypothetical protein BD410DRAFT_726563 [Rickenella mellea]
MACKNCEQNQRKFFCEPCLRNHLRSYRASFQRVSEERDEQVTKAQRTLDEIEPRRKRKAEKATLQAKVEDVRRNLTILKENNEKTRQRLATLRSTLSDRRKSLSQASGASTPNRNASTRNATPVQKPATILPSPTHSEIVRFNQALVMLQDALSRARSGLVQELVEVFSIVEVGGRPPLGGKAGSKGEWTIGGLVLPVPGDIRRYPPSQINAVVTHTIHFLGLLTFYLGIKLPFEIAWSGGKLGVGQPSIYAGRGAESGGWARWTSRNPLHLPLTSTPTSSTPASATKTNAPSLPANATAMSASQSIADLDAQAFTQTPASFTTALAMLLYNVAYLAHTQGVEVPLSHTGEVLRNLWAVCCSPELGRLVHLRSHETHPLLSPPTPPTFPLDFAQLLQATTANPASRARPRSRRSSSSAGGAAGGRGGGKVYDIINEEDEWEVVDR